MTKDDVIRMAEEVYGNKNKPFHESALLHLERFAALVAAAEREACAKVAESYEPECDTCPSGVSNAIRAREQK